MNAIQSQRYRANVAVLEFLHRYPDKWHSFNRACVETGAVVTALAEFGSVRVNAFDQMRLDA
jgi:hypothetical protein